MSITKGNHTTTSQVEVTQEQSSQETSENLSQQIEQNTIMNTKEILDAKEGAIKKLLRREIRNFVKKSDFSFFDKYKNFQTKEFNEEIFIKKFEKYYEIHENILLDAIREGLEQLPKRNKIEQQNLFKEYINRYLYILFIFSEKIKIVDLENNIRQPAVKLASMYATTSSSITTLEDFGHNETEKLKEMYPEFENSNFIDEIFLSSMYRHLHKEKIKKNPEDIALNIEKGIEENYQFTFNKLYYIFATWAESGYQKSQSGLLNIEIVLRRLIDGMIFMKEKHIAFSDFPVENMNNPEFLKNFSSKFVGEKYFKSYGPVFEKFIECACTDDKSKKEDFYKAIDSDLKKIAKEKSESRIPPKTQRQENLNEERVSIKDWEKVSDEQKYEIVFSSVLSHNGKMKFAKFLNLGDAKYFEEFFAYYAFKQEVKEEERKNYRLSLKNQLNEIIASEGMTVKEFIKNDVNNLNFLILWWRFVLKIRQNNGNVKANEISSITETPYGITERISENLKDVIEKGNITFDPDGRIANTSVKGTDAILMDLLKGLKKGFIDINQETIILVDGKEKNLGQIRDFYLPRGIASEKLTSKEEIAKVQNYIDSGIDMFFNLLQQKEITDKDQKIYYENIIESKILPEGELTKEDLEKIQYLVEILKFTKNRIKHIEDMLRIADDDTEILKKNTVLNSILAQDKESGFGPRKKFSRGFEKLMAEYGGNFNEIGDFTRLRVMVEDIDEMVEKVSAFVRAADSMEEVTHVAIADKTGEPISIPQKASGYRDTKILLKMQSGNTVEVQFQYRDMYNMKDKGLNLEAEENNHIFEKMKKEESLLTAEELQKFLDESLKRGVELPTQKILEKLTKDSQETIDWGKYQKILTKNTISTDNTYHITRTLDKKHPVRIKFTRLERVLSDSAWSQIVLRHLEKRNVQL